MRENRLTGAQWRALRELARPVAIWTISQPTADVLIRLGYAEELARDGKHSRIRITDAGRKVLEGGA